MNQVMNTAYFYPGDRPGVYYSTLQIWSPLFACFFKLDSSISHALASNEALFVTENAVAHTNAKFRNAVTCQMMCTAKP